MNEKNTKKREWVKTAAIVFLSVLLVLTFFSNTIMNYSLPVVASQYITSGSVTAKVRGTGTIEAGDPYKIEITETRVVSSVAVKKGDKVEKDQILFYLEDAESTELVAAETKLEADMTKFKTGLLDGKISNNVVNNVQNGVESPISVYQKKIKTAQDKVDTLTAKLAELDRQIALGSITTAPDTSAEEAAVATAISNVANTESILAAEQKRLSDAQIGTILDGVTRTKQQALDNANAMKIVADASLIPMNTAEASMKTEAAKVNALLVVQTAKTALDATPGDPNLQTALTNAVTAANSLGCSVAADASDIATVLATNQTNYNTAATKYAEAKIVYEAGMKNYQSALGQYNALVQEESLKVAVTNAQNAVNAASQAKIAADLALANKKNSGDNSAAVNEIKKQRVDIEVQQKTAQTDLDQTVLDIGQEINLGAQSDEIQKQRDLVEELRAKAVGAEIKAPVAGTVTSIDIVAGEKTDPTKSLAVVQPDGKGYALSFSVTVDQAKTLTPGDPAEIQNSWYYNEISATLAQIKNDPENPGKNKLLVFNIDGDVTGGQSLSLSIGQKSANYDMIVPKSAVREDNNGKFILIVESKSSPLGNRYVATRVDVEVLASDDTQIAVSGALYGSEYVITTSNKPVEAGKLVRLADN